MIEVADGACFHAVSANAGFRDVQIHLHDALLAPEVLDKDREPCLQAFAEEPSILPQKGVFGCLLADRRSEEHTSELQSLMRISYAVFCLKKKTQNDEHIE